MKHDTDDSYVLHSTIQFVTKSLNEMKFNTSLSKLMEFINHFYEKGLDKHYKEVFIRLLSPFAPHIAEEMWEKIGFKETVFNEKWPKFDIQETMRNEIDIAIQVNGKLRGSIKVDVSETKENVIILAKKQNNVVSHIEGKNIIKEIYIEGKIINFVVN